MTCKLTLKNEVCRRLEVYTTPNLPLCQLLAVFLLSFHCFKILQIHNSQINLVDFIIYFFGGDDHSSVQNSYITTPGQLTFWNRAHERHIVRQEPPKHMRVTFHMEGLVSRLCFQGYCSLFKEKVISLEDEGPCNSVINDLWNYIENVHFYKILFHIYN